jgi:molybdate/tungstate transport system substrate-binding protein
MNHVTTIDRRSFIFQGSLMSAGLIISPALRLIAQPLSTLNVASAGSMRAMLEGPLKTFAAQALALDIHTHAQGADAVAASLLDGSLSADAFMSITAHPMFTILRAGEASIAQPIARTELVLLYSPRSRFLKQFELAAQGKANWWEILQQTGLRIARSSPALDPSGRAVIFVMMLAAKKYSQPDLVAKVLGPTINPDQILTGGDTQARLQRGEIDVMAVYKTGPAATGQPFIALPQDINLSSSTLREDHPDLSLTVGSNVFYPEPLIFYAAALKNAAHPAETAAFLAWLQGKEAQALFKQAHFDPIGDPTPLHL